MKSGSKKIGDYYVHDDYLIYQVPGQGRIYRMYSRGFVAVPDDGVPSDHGTVREALDALRAPK